MDEGLFGLLALNDEPLLLKGLVGGLSQEGADGERQEQADEAVATLTRAPKKGVEHKKAFR